MTLLTTAISVIFIIFALFGGIFFSFRLKFFQIRNFFALMRSSVGQLFHKNKAVESLKASATALAGAIGVGNITGVGTAIALGGAGAVFWIWISAVLLMSVKYSEIFISMRYKRKNAAGETSGGPMHYLRNGANKKRLAAVFAAVCFATALLMGNMIQANAAALCFQDSFAIPPVLTGAAMSLMAAVVLAGGARRVLDMCAVLVPVFAVVYIGISVYIICAYSSMLPRAVASIINGAFSKEAIAGGGAWLALRYGLSRGVFTNEAGIGSSAIIHAESDADNPYREGAFGVFEVFFDTIVVCTLTALPILMLLPEGDGVLYAASCFEQAMPGFGAKFISVSVFIFAYATIIGWSLPGRRSLEYLAPKVRPFAANLAFITAPVIGALSGAAFLWQIADIANAAMLVINMTALIILRKQIFFDVKKLG